MKMLFVYLGKGVHVDWQSRRTPLLCAAAPPNCKGSETQYSVCTGTACSKQGSQAIRTAFTLLSDKAPYVQVTECGCLGECGSGPNVVTSAAKTIHNRVTSVDDILPLLSGHVTPDEQIVQALHTKEQADGLISHKHSKFSAQAAQMYEAVSKLVPQGEFQVSVLCNWSAALLENGQAQRALLVANDAVDMDHARLSAWKRKAQAHEHLCQYDDAINAWTICGRLGNKNNQTEATKSIERVQRNKRRQSNNSSSLFRLFT